MMSQLAVLLPHHNNLEGLRLTLQSLTLEKERFTLFIIDDGSDNQDKLEDIINLYAKQLTIILVKQPECLGVTKTLNNGLSIILKEEDYKFIARLDAGDRCLNTRFTHQLKALKEDEELALVSSWVTFVDDKRDFLFDFKVPVNNEKLKKSIYQYNPFIHPAVMYKTEAVKQIGFYPENYPALEDHAYFFNFIKHFKVEVLPQLLLEYEINPNSISTLKRKEQTKSRIRLLWHHYNFSLTSTIGLIRACITYFIPQKTMLYFKKAVFYK